MAVWLRGKVSRGRVGLLVAGLICLIALPGETEETSQHGAARATGDSTAKKDHRIREGAKLEGQLGEFREAGERIRFYLSDEKTSFVAVENLALERVSRVLDENTSSRTWSVSGVVTEFRGGNYLIVTRAAVKARAKKTKSRRE